MATIRNLLIRISVSEDTAKGVRNVTAGLRETNRELDSADKSSGRFSGTLSKLGRTSLGGLTGGLKSMARYTGVAAKGLLAVAAAASALNTVTSVGVGLAPLLGGLALVPAVAVSAATAIGVLKLATSGLDKAFKDAMKPGTSAKDLAEELKYVSPAARATVLELNRLQPTLLGIRNTVQQALFRPLVGQLTALAKILGGPVKVGASGVAAEFGLAGRKIAEFARQSKSVELVKAAFGQTQQAIANVLPALEPLLKGFRALATEGLSFLPRIGTALGQIGTRFGEWLQQMVKSGQATRWINNFFNTLKQLGGVLKNVGGILSSVFSAASAAGSGFLGVIGQALGQLNVFLKTAAGKSALRSIFEGLGQIGKSLSPVIAALVKGLGLLAAPIGRLATLLGPILATVINALAPALAALEPGLKAIFVGLGAAVTALAPALLPLAQAIASIGVALGPVLPVVAKALAQVGVAIAPILPVVAQLAALIVNQLGASLTQLVLILGPVIAAIATSLAPVLPQIAKAFADVAVAMAPIATQFGKQLGDALVKILPPLIAIVPQLVNGLLPALTQLAIAMVPLLPQLIQLAVVLATNLSDSLPQLIPPLITLVGLMVQWAIIMVPVLSWIIQISTALASVLGPGVTTAVEVIAWGLKLIFGWFQWLFDVLLGHSIIPDIANGIVAWFGSLPGRVVGLFVSMATGAVAVASGMLRSLAGIPGTIMRIFSGAGSWLYNAGRNIMIGLWNGVASLWNWLVGKFRSLTDLIPHVKGPPARDRKLLTPAGAAIMRGLVAGIDSGVPGLRAALGGVTDIISTNAAPAWAMPAGVAAAGAGASGGGPAGIDAKTLAAAVKDALHGTTVQMDGEPVGRIVSRQQGRLTDQRRRTG